MSKKRHAHRRRHRKHRSHPQGVPPGSIIIDPESPKPAIHLMAFTPEKYTETDITDLDQIARYLNEWTVTWVNVDGLGDEQIIRKIGDIFKLHRLALEDVVTVTQRPKVDLYGDHIYIVGRMITRRFDFETEQVSIFLGSNFVLTFQETRGDCLDPIRNRIRKKLGRVRDAGADYLAYALLDTIMDDYFPALEEFGERLESLEDEILDRPAPDILARVRAVKRDLLGMRRAVWPQREAINALMRDPLPHITNETRIYLRDCYDHVIRVMDLTESHRELSSDLMDVYLSSLSNRMNEIMKTLTVIASIFIPLTFIVGIYGMNFDIESSPLNMPELYWYWGYPAVMIFMLVLALGMLWLFTRKGWVTWGRYSRTVLPEAGGTDESLPGRAKPPAAP